MAGEHECAHSICASSGHTRASKGCLHLCAKLHSHEWQVLVFMHKALFAQAEGACTQSSICTNGASQEHKCPLLMQVELHMRTRACPSLLQPSFNQPTTRGLETPANAANTQSFTNRLCLILPSGLHLAHPLKDEHSWKDAENYVKGIKS